MTDFADDTNFRYESPSLTDSNRKLNYDMSRVTHWVRAKKKKKFLNVMKTEMITFRLDRTRITRVKLSNKWS